MSRYSTRRSSVVVLLLLAAVLVGCTTTKDTRDDSGEAQVSSEPGSTQPSTAIPPVASAATASASATAPTTGAALLIVGKAAVVPQPRSVQPTDSAFTLTAKTAIVTAGGAAERQIAEAFAVLLRRSTSFPFPVVSGGEPKGNIVFGSTGADVGDEGYVLEVAADGVRLSSHYPAGLFYGVQTVRQLLPPQLESAAAQPGPWTIPGGRIEDSPRFAWRGAMLDVSRHFFGVEAVRRYIDHISLYKMNVLHLHLSDDQGWRIAIDAWPRLTEVGGRSQVGGGKGGFYTKADYAAIVAYAAQRYVTIVPEIDMPGHTNAALSAYADLNCNGKARKPYTGTEVGFSSLCVDSDRTWAFVADVVSELAAMTPGHYIHIGGDEVEKLPATEYAAFVTRVEGIVTKAGKGVVGWAEIGKADIGKADIGQAQRSPRTIVQYWNTGRGDDVVREAVARGAQVLLSPAPKTYLDMKYDNDTPLGLKWAGFIEVKDAWDWDPATLIGGVSVDNIVGVEAPMWSETLETVEDVEMMAFPRLPAIAEVAWSAQEGREWQDFRRRLGAQAPRWKAMKLGFYESPQIDWAK